jgi:hypothetical protein
MPTKHLLVDSSIVFTDSPPLTPLTNVLGPGGVRCIEIYLDRYMKGGRLPQCEGIQTTGAMFVI